MIDINLIREKPDEVRKALLKRMDSVDFTGILKLDEKRRDLIRRGEILKERRNNVSQEIPAKKSAGEDVSALLGEMKKVSSEIKELDNELSVTAEILNNMLLELPNVPADDVLPGGKENNKVIRSWGDVPRFSFKIKDHVSLVASLGLIDYERGVKMGGSGFWIYTGDGALLEWALLSYFIRDHIRDGYVFMLPPHLLLPQCGITAGQFPKFKDDVFHLEEGSFLLPTSETALINLHRDEILTEKELPKKYFAYTPCYRKEAGSYRTEERGMIRGHQFNKVEIFQYTRPEDSEKALEELIGKAERLVRGLDLHYRVSKLAARDCGATMAKTYDIEVWIPSMKDYKEVSSASNAMEYQARRGNIRFKRLETKRNEYVHTLNASGLATSRIMPAIVEQNQNADGSVNVPEALQEWIGKSVLTPKK